MRTIDRRGGRPALLGDSGVTLVASHARPSVVAAEYHATINAPRKAIFWIEEAGHVPNLENTEAFNMAVSQVLADARSLG